MNSCNCMAGMVRLEIVPEWSVERIRRAGGLASVELAEGAEWRKIAMEEGEYSETAGSGDAKSRTLRCTLAIGLGANLLREIELMTEERYVARVTDGRGVQWIVGDEQEPLTLTWSRTNEGKAAGRDEVEVTLSGEGRWGATEARTAG